ncbi:fungal-specific transcription factor domain-containing protein [Hyaloraphidium curvatum]|nr:fungal-specific transcription factor domain-containing protein [Hyaloraphidium curvatum]
MFSPVSDFAFVPDLLGTFDQPGPNWSLLSEQMSRSITGAQPLQFTPVVLPQLQQPVLSVEDALADLFPQDSPESFDDHISGSISWSGRSDGGSEDLAARLPPVTVTPGFPVTFSLPLNSRNAVLESYPPELVQSLLVTFFENCYSICGIFQPTTFLSSVDRQPPVVLYAMMALAAKSSPHPLANAAEFFEKAKDELGRELELGPSLALAQALHVLTLYSMASGGLGSLSYIYSSLATRVCFELGLNQEPPRDMGFLASETRRRVFWTIYGTDRLQTVAGNRPPAVKDGECQLRLPISEIVWQGTLGDDGGYVKMIPDAYELAKVVGLKSLNGAVGDGGAYVVFPESDLQEFAENALTWMDAPEENLVSRLNPIRGKGARLDSFTHYIILVNIYGKVHAFHSQCLAGGINPFAPDAPHATRSRLRTLDAALMDWMAALPDWWRIIALDAVFRSRVLIRSNDPDSVQRVKVGAQRMPGANARDHSYHTVFIHLFFHGICIVLHRPRRLEEMARDAVWLASESFVRCAESAETMAGLVTTLLAQPDRKLVSLHPAAMFLVFQAALIELLILRNLLPKVADPAVRKLAAEAKAKVELHRHFLDDMARAWKGEPMLGDLLNRLLSHVSLPLATDGPEILQLRGK